MASYAYDYRGRRISRTIYGAPNVTIRYAYDGDRILAEYDGSGTLRRKFVYGPGVDEPICLIDVANGNAAYYYHLDGLGSVVALSDVNNVLVERYAYDVFGRPTIRDPNGVTIAESARGNPYLFTGRAYDAESGLYYYRARYYDYATGRFFQPDPIGYSDGLNLYTYVGNDPLAYIDPFGLCKETPIPIVVSAEEVKILMLEVARDMALARVFAGKLGQYALAYGLHSAYGALDTKMLDSSDVFVVPGVKGSGPNGALTPSEFGNYMAGFSGGLIGGDGYVLVRAGGHAIAGLGQLVAYIGGYTPEETISDAPSILFINAGAKASKEYYQPPIRVPLPLPKR